MGGATRLHRLLLLPTLLYLPFLTHADGPQIDHSHDNDDGLFRFVSRPELKAPRWLVNVTDAKSVAPGYWFVAPFETIDQRDPANGWTGPHIYDSRGELVWSGVDVAHGWDAIDFRMSNVRGQYMLTWLVQRTGDGYILDNTYRVQEQLDLGTLGVDFNSHEFYFIDGGSKAIVMTENRTRATAEQLKAVAWEKDCTVGTNGFKVLDTATWEQLFNWTALDHVGLDESSQLDGGVEGECTNGWAWDFIHANSVDQDQNGDYFVSGRHTDTIYKISKHDGHVMWRLHGQNASRSDFDMGDDPPVRFGRQHNVRFRGFNGTHETISLLDNANGQDTRAPTADRSRGLVLALETGAEPKRARIVSQIDHPYGRGHFAPRRGSYQVLDNRNVFIGWSEQATHSEHAPDGTLVMEARLVPEWLGSYRSYKFPFAARPAEPPAVHAAARHSAVRNATVTTVHVSQNGATDIHRWIVYRTTQHGAPTVPVARKNKTGFETALVWPGFASHVVVEAVDRDGRVLATSPITRTVSPGGAVSAAAAAADDDELLWLQGLEGGGRSDDERAHAAASSPGALAASSLAFFLAGAASSLVLVVLIFRWQKKNRHRSGGGGTFTSFRSARYAPLPPHRETRETPPRRAHGAKPSRDMSSDPFFFRTGV